MPHEEVEPFIPGLAPEPPLCPQRTPERLARPEDPNPSHEAAAAIVPNLTALQMNVRDLLRQIGPSTHHRLIRAYRDRYGTDLAESTIRTRVSELLEMGAVYDTGQTATIAPSGRKAVIWAAR